MGSPYRVGIESGKSRTRKQIKEIKREEINERLAAWRDLTPEQQLAALDRRLGKDVGAKKQRARIKAAIAKRIKADAEEKATTRSKKKRRKRESGKHS
jgi:hypothetical protein